MNFDKFLDIEIPCKGIPTTEEAGRSFANKFGYACEDFEDRGVFNLQFLGCSWTQGGAGESTNSFSTHVCKRFSEIYGVKIGNWNMGLGSRSSDYMARTLLCSVDYLKPDIVFLTFPGIDRREYFMPDGRKIRYQVDWIWESEANGPHWQKIGFAEREVIGHLNELVSPYDNYVNFLKNYKLIEMTLNMRDIMWGFSMVNTDYVIDPILKLLDAGWLDSAKYIGTPFVPIDHYSEQDSHPGVESHKAFGELIFNWFHDKYGSRLEQFFGELKER